MKNHPLPEGLSEYNNLEQYGFYCFGKKKGFRNNSRSGFGKRPYDNSVYNNFASSTYGNRLGLPEGYQPTNMQTFAPDPSNPNVILGQEVIPPVYIPDRKGPLPQPYGPTDNYNMMHPNINAFGRKKNTRGSKKVSNNSKAQKNPKARKSSKKNYSYGVTKLNYMNDVTNLGNPLGSQGLGPLPIGRPCHGSECYNSAKAVGFDFQNIVQRPDNLYPILTYKDYDLANLPYETMNQSPSPSGPSGSSFGKMNPKTLSYYSPSYGQEYNPVYSRGANTTNFLTGQNYFNVSDAGLNYRADQYNNYLQSGITKFGRKGQTKGPKKNKFGAVNTQYTFINPDVLPYYNQYKNPVRLNPMKPGTISFGRKKSMKKTIIQTTKNPIKKIVQSKNPIKNPIKNSNSSFTNSKTKLIADLNYKKLHRKQDLKKLISSSRNSPKKKHLIKVQTQDNIQIILNTKTGSVNVK
jgi:hypothetical protein